MKDLTYDEILIFACTVLDVGNIIVWKRKKLILSSRSVIIGG
jgi:hypothetical protein